MFNQSQSNHLWDLFLNGLQTLFGCSGHITSPFFFHDRTLKDNSCWSSHRSDLTNTGDGQEAEYSSVGWSVWELFSVDCIPRSWANLVSCHGTGLADNKSCKLSNCGKELENSDLCTWISQLRKTGNSGKEEYKETAEDWLTKTKKGYLKKINLEYFTQCKQGSGWNQW